MTNSLASLKVVFGPPPVNAEFGWRQWCEQENFAMGTFDQEFRFNLAEDSNVITVDCAEDLEKLTWCYVEKHRKYYLDFESMLANGIDAIYLTTEGIAPASWATGKNLYGWDCESILILNPDVIEF